jgi:hypothetical protein
MRPRGPALLATIAAALLTCVLATGGTAAAHSDEGELELTRFEQLDETTVEVEVGVVYTDEHLAEDASVTATLTSAEGETVGPVDLVRTGETTSLYGATVALPGAGSWTVTASSTNPTGSVEGRLVVAPPVPTTTTSTTAPGSTTTEPSDVAAEQAAATQTGGDDDGSGPSAALVVGACVVLAALVIGGAVLVARRRGAADAT